MLQSGQHCPIWLLLKRQPLSASSGCRSLQPLSIKEQWQSIPCMLKSNLRAQAEAGERKPAAFVHLRWEKDDTEGWPVLYCYDIQLEPCVQRKGLGRRAPQPYTTAITTRGNLEIWR